MSIFLQQSSSPVGQDFVWVAEYYDNTHLAEFDFDTKVENSFYSIQRERLMRFGMLGHGHRLFFEVDGIFNLSGRSIEFIYRTKDKDYRLTGNIANCYNDIITYKDAEAISNVIGLANQEGRFSTRVTQFNFGYKANFETQGVTFGFKALVKIPYNAPMTIQLRLVADTELDGEFIVRVNGLTEHSFHAPLEPNVGGELNWQVQ